MAPNTAYYRTIINDVGYRFAIPLLLAPPPLLGDLVDIEVTLFVKDPNKVITTSSAASGPVTRRSPSLDFPTLDIVLAGASWQLPLLDAGGAGDDDEVYKLQVRRMPPPAQSYQRAPGMLAATSTPSALGTGFNRVDIDSPALTEAQAASSGNESVNEDVAYLELNESYKNRVSRTQYVDILPNHDPPLCRFSEQRLVSPTTWAIDKAKRYQDWHDLNHQGVPCKILDGEYLSITAHGFNAVSLKMTCAPLQDGDARLKLVPVPVDYGCQPAAASAEASHILNRYSITVEQEGCQHLVYEPVGKEVDDGWHDVLRVLAEYESAEKGLSLTYSEECSRTGCFVDFYEFGVRLRDGGARLPLKSKSGSTSTTRLRLPCTALDYATHGTCMDIEEADMYNLVVVDVHLHPGTNKPHDIVFKVRDHADGAYEEIMYGPRGRGELRSVSEGQWSTFDSSHTDEATLRFIANAARASFGRSSLRPQCPPRSSRDSLSEDSPEREEKKPRLS